MHDIVDRGKPGSLDRDTLGEKVELPQRELIELEREHDDRPARDAAQLRKPGVGRFPVVNSHARHRRVDCVVIERQRLCVSGDRWGSVGRSLGAHRWARLNRENPTIRRLIRARPSANVEHCARTAKRGVNPLRNPRIGAPVACVGAPVLLVVDTANRQ